MILTTVVKLKMLLHLYIIKELVNMKKICQTKSYQITNIKHMFILPEV